MRKFLLDYNLKVSIPVILFVAIATFAVTYYASYAERNNIGYQPSQPINFSHKLHAGAGQGSVTPATTATNKVNVIPRRITGFLHSKTQAHGLRAVSFSCSLLIRIADLRRPPHRSELSFREPPHLPVCVCHRSHRNRRHGPRPALISNSLGPPRTAATNLDGR